MTVPLQTPVAMLIFNRPEPTRRVFESIRAARPTRLLVVADGPRADRPGEADRCAACRAIATAVDWPCEVLTNFSETNLGCRRRVSSGITWVFDTVEEAIILEDDCLPHPDFFPFCAELLAYYRDDERVMHIGGSNFQGGRRHGAASYYFSRYAHVWGWASWRRAWRHYDVDMARWPADAARALAGVDHPDERRYWRFVWDMTARGRIDTWDYQWAFTCVSRDGLAVIPNANLVTNIGFGPDATHTIGISRIAGMAVEPLDWPLVHPTGVSRSVVADGVMRGLTFRRQALPVRILEKFVRLGVGDKP